MKPATFCVHAYDEAAALQRLVRSSYPFAELIDEWVIVDHRSGDATPQVIEGLRAELAERSIRLTAIREERDLSASFTFADLRTATIKAARNEIVVLHDADFVLGPAFGAMLARAGTALHKGCATASYTVPVVWDKLSVDAAGRIAEHGRVWVHSRRPRVLRRSAVHYEQTKDGGRWERLVSTGPDYPLTPGRRSGLPRDGVLSVNVKPAERIALRDTMTMFMQDAVQGKAEGDWLENYREGRTRSQGAYDYVQVNLRGWRLNVKSLELAA